MEKYWKLSERKLIKGMCWVYWIISWVCKHFSLWLYHLCLFIRAHENMGFPCSSVGKESACNAGDRGSSPGSGRSSGEENGNPLQYSCLGNPMDRGAWWASVYGFTHKHRLLLLLLFSCFTLSDFLYFPYGLQFVRLLCPWNSLGKSTRVGCHALLQGIFLTQGSNPCLLHCRQTPYHWVTRETHILLLLLLSRFSSVCLYIDGSLPGPAVPGILLARTLEWVVISFSNAWKWSRSVVSNS